MCNAVEQECIERRGKVALDEAYSIMQRVQSDLNRLYYLIEGEVNVYLAPETHRLDVVSHTMRPPTVRIKVV